MSINEAIFTIFLVLGVLPITAWWLLNRRREQQEAARDHGGSITITAGTGGATPGVGGAVRIAGGRVSGGDLVIRGGDATGPSSVVFDGVTFESMTPEAEAQMERTFQEAEERMNRASQYVDLRMEQAFQNAERTFQQADERLAQSFRDMSERMATMGVRMGQIAPRLELSLRGRPGMTTTERRLPSGGVEVRYQFQGPLDAEQLRQALEQLGPEGAEKIRQNIAEGNKIQAPPPKTIYDRLNEDDDF